ncbi:hypothetical protein V8C43DRAFT_272819 [Trichoderma afarasin]
MDQYAKIGTLLLFLVFCSVSVLWPLTGPGVSLRPVGLRLTIPAYLWTEERKKLPLVLMLMLLFLLSLGCNLGGSPRDWQTQTRAFARGKSKVSPSHRAMWEPAVICIWGRKRTVLAGGN